MSPIHGKINIRRDKMKKYVLALALVVCVFTLTACGKTNQLVGTWIGDTNDGMETTFEFKSNGKVHYDNEYGFSSDGTYEIKDAVVTISLESWEKAKEYKFEVKDNTLTLTATDAYSPNYPSMKKK